MRFGFTIKARSVGLDVGQGEVAALVLEQRRADVVVGGWGLKPIEADGDSRLIGQAIQSALADAGAGGEPVIAAIGGPDVVIRQIPLPPVPEARILAALELQHRELGLLSPGDAVMDAQVLRKSKDGTSNEILSASVPKARLDERMRLFEQVAVHVRMLDVEPLALLNGAIHLTGLDDAELLVLLTLGRQTSVLCLFSEQGPVVARYLNVGAETFLDQLRHALGPSTNARNLPPSEIQKAEAACREVVERMAEDIRLSLTFYRTEYDRESLPRYAIAGSVDLPQIGRWVADRLGLGAPLELMDPLKAVDVKAGQMRPDRSSSGPQLLQAFGLALRGL